MTGAPNGVSRQQPYDRWFRYPAGFSAQTLERCFEAAGEVGDDQILADPFCGAATVGTHRAEKGGRFVGLEAHPLLVELARTKFRTPPRSPAHLTTTARDLVARAEAPSIENEADLVRRCFDDKTLSTLCGIRAELDAEPVWRAHLTWALLGTLRDVASVRVGWPYQRPGKKRKPIVKDPAARFEARAARIADDLSQRPLRGNGRVRLADSRRRSAWDSALDSETVKACITSSPYLNNFDYADATRLELFFLGRASSWKEMCETVRSRMLVATTQQSRVGLAKRDSARVARVAGIETEVTELVGRLATERERRDRGKEYDRMLPSYLNGIHKVLVNLSERVAPNARIVWVIGDSAPYGVRIDTPGLIAAMAETVGLDLTEDELLRARGTRWRTNGARHRVSLEERMLVFTRRH